MHREEDVIALTKQFLLDHPDKVKKEMQCWLLVKEKISKNLASARASAQYTELVLALDSLLSFGPFYGMHTDEPQWEVSISRFTKAHFLCGIDHSGLYVMADIDGKERARVRILLTL